MINIDCLYKTHRSTCWTERLEKRTMDANHRQSTWFIEGRRTTMVAYGLRVVVPTQAHTAWKLCSRRYWKCTPNDRLSRWRRKKIVYVGARRDVYRRLISYYYYYCVVNCVVFAKSAYRNVIASIVSGRTCRMCPYVVIPSVPFFQCSITTAVGLFLVFLVWWSSNQTLGNVFFCSYPFGSSGRILRMLGGCQ